MASRSDRVERALESTQVAARSGPLQESPGAEQALDAEALSLLAQAEAVAPAPELKARLLRTLSPEMPFHGYVERLGAILDLEESRLREVLVQARDPESRAWKLTPLDGVRLQPFAGGPAVDGAECAIVSVPIGGCIPQHRHTGTELSFILSGAAEEGDGHLSLPGDLGIRETGTSHTVQSVGEQPLLFVAVMRGPLEFAGAEHAPPGRVQESR